jgi:PPOX class probable F420-dependent enzyme
MTVTGSGAIMGRIMAPRSDLSDTERAFLADARRAVLATVDPHELPRLVPVCFVLDPTRPIVYTPLDDKPKRVEDVRGLARVRDLLARPDVSLLVDRWDEDWARLAWLRLGGRADLLEPTEATDHPTIVAALREKYPQYVAHDLDARPIIRIAIERVTSWGDLGGA